MLPARALTAAVRTPLASGAVAGVSVRSVGAVGALRTPGALVRRSAVAGPGGPRVGRRALPSLPLLVAARRTGMPAVGRRRRGRPVHRELGGLARGNLAFDAGQHGADQPAVHRPFRCAGQLQRRLDDRRIGRNDDRRGNSGGWFLASSGNRLRGSAVIAPGGGFGGRTDAVFFRAGGTLACRYSCSVSHVVQRVWRISSATMATTAWWLTRRSRGQ